MQSLQGPGPESDPGVLRGTARSARRGMLRAAAVLAALAMATGQPVARAAKPGPKPPPAAGSFVDHFAAYDPVRWSKADGWKNGSPFDNAWRADHATVTDGRLELRLDDVAYLGEPYSAGELRSNAYYGYGCYEASFKPIMQPGVVTSLFTFAGPYDDGGNGRHNEIDVEFLGNHPGWVQLNFWTNDDTYASRNERLVNLGFDPTLQFHRYGFKWTADRVEWYIDGNLVYTAFDSRTNPTPKATESLQRIMVNAWPVDETAELWAGRFEYRGTPLGAPYEWIRHVAGADCDLTLPPAEAPPPSGEPGTLSVLGIDLALNAQATQVIARVSVVDGGGTVNFCVVAVQHASLGYAPDANVETCDAIVK